MSSSILFASPSRVLLETDNPRARADVADTGTVETEDVLVCAVRAGAFVFVSRKCGWLDGTAGRGIVGGGASGAWRAAICRRRIGRRLGHCI